MAEKVTGELIAFISFVVVGFLIIIWLVSQLQEFAFFFGTRLSDVIAGDLSGVVLASGGVSGSVNYTYEIKAGKAASQSPTYKIYLGNHLICIQSIWDVSFNTTDCYPVASSGFTNKLSSATKAPNQISSALINITKMPAFFDSSGTYHPMRIFVEG